MLRGRIEKLPALSRHPPCVECPTIRHGAHCGVGYSALAHRIAISMLGLCLVYKGEPILSQVDRGGGACYVETARLMGLCAATIGKNPQ